jgi:hypothetical protein
MNAVSGPGSTAQNITMAKTQYVHREMSSPYQDTMHVP